VSTFSSDFDNAFKVNSFDFEIS